VKQPASRRERKADNSGPSKRVVIPVVRISDAHRDDGRRFIVRADEKLTAFVASPAKKDALRKEFKADATEMEGAAVAQICWQRRVPCLILRSLSDSAGAKAPENVLLFEKSAAQNSALLVISVLGRLEAQTRLTSESRADPVLGRLAPELEGRWHPRGLVELGADEHHK
jgi:Phosphorylase superfamily